MGTYFLDACVPSLFPFPRKEHSVLAGAHADNLPSVGSGGWLEPINHF